jgi:abnormal spindle-like microcephaly-associated protein
MILLRQKNKAAKQIQAMWRGYIHRVKLQTKTMRAISNKIEEAKRNREPTATISHQLKLSLKFLRGTYNLSEALSVLRRLEVISRTVPHLLIDHAAFVANFCYGLMAQAIRSEADKPLIELCACIILNLARYSGTKVEAFQANGLKTIAQMLLRWCDKECGIFNTMCTLVWIFSHSAKENEVSFGRKYLPLRSLLSVDTIFRLFATT